MVSWAKALPASSVTAGIVRGWVTDSPCLHHVHQPMCILLRLSNLMLNAMIRIQNFHCLAQIWTSGLIEWHNQKELHYVIWDAQQHHDQIQQVRFVFVFYLLWHFLCTLWRFLDRQHTRTWPMIGQGQTYSVASLLTRTQEEFLALIWHGEHCEDKNTM